MLKSLERRAFSASLTMGVVALCLISLLLLAVAIVCAFSLTNKINEGLIPIFVISLGGGGIGLWGSLLWYLRKAREYMRAESVELDLSHPGFYDYYYQWQAKLDDKITEDSGMY